MSWFRRADAPAPAPLSFTDERERLSRERFFSLVDALVEHSDAANLLVVDLLGRIYRGEPTLTPDEAGRVMAIAQQHLQTNQELRAAVKAEREKHG